MLRRFFLALHCLRVPREERGVGFFRAAFVLWPAEWPSGKPEWAGRGFAQQHQVSQYFLHRCLLFVYLQNKRHGHLFLSLWFSSRSSHRLSFVRCPLLCKFNSYFIGVSVRWESKVPLCRYKRTENNSGTKWWVPPSASGWRHTLKLFWYTVFKIRFTGNNFCFLYKAGVSMEGQAFMNPINLTSKLLIFSLFF